MRRTRRPRRPAMDAVWLCCADQPSNGRAEPLPVARGLPSEVLVLLIRFAVQELGGLLLAGRVAHDARRRVLVAVGGVLDQFLLGELKALGLASAGLIDSHTRLAASFLQVTSGVGGRQLVHRLRLPSWLAVNRELANGAAARGRCRRATRRL